MIVIKKFFYPCPFSTQDHIILSVRTSLPSSYTLYFSWTSFIIFLVTISLGLIAPALVLYIIPVHIVSIAVLQFMTLHALFSPQAANLLKYMLTH